MAINSITTGHCCALQSAFSCISNSSENMKRLCSHGWRRPSTSSFSSTDYTTQNSTLSLTPWTSHMGTVVLVIIKTVVTTVTTILLTIRWVSSPLGRRITRIWATTGPLQRHPAPPVKAKLRETVAAVIKEVVTTTTETVPTLPTPRHPSPRATSDLCTTDHIIIINSSSSSHSAPPIYRTNNNTT